MKRLTIIIFLLGALLEAKATGHLNRQDDYRLPIIATATPAPTVQATPEASSPPCVLDWSLPYTEENARILSECYEARRAYGIVEYFCAPAYSIWEQYTNSMWCFFVNYGTPAALTATVQPPTPTIEWPPTEVTPTPPAYP